MAMEWLVDPQISIARVDLPALEIVLGIDNVVFISILAGKLPPPQQPRARRLGLAAAMLTRIVVLASLAWMIRLTAPLVELFGHAFSGRVLLLITGGLFLLAKSTTEIHERLEGMEGRLTARVVPAVSRRNVPNHLPQYILFL